MCLVVLCVFFVADSFVFLCTCVSKNVVTLKVTDRNKVDYSQNGLDEEIVDVQRPLNVSPYF